MSSCSGRLGRSGDIPQLNNNNIQLDETSLIRLSLCVDTVNAPELRSDRSGQVVRGVETFPMCVLQLERPPVTAGVTRGETAGMLNLKGRDGGRNRDQRDGDSPEVMGRKTKGKTTRAQTYERFRLFVRIRRLPSGDPDSIPDPFGLWGGEPRPVGHQRGATRASWSSFVPRCSSSSRAAGMR